MVMRRGGIRQGMVTDCARRGNQKGRIGNGNGRTRNGSLPLTALISSRDSKGCLWSELMTSTCIS
jgi:hypothetical protein